MAIWLIRAGPHGEYEQQFISKKRVYVTWDRFAVSLTKPIGGDLLTAEMAKHIPECNS